MISLILRGRIGNQLFMYAYAEALRQMRGGKEKIRIYDYEVLNEKWENSLRYYPIENVEYVHYKYPKDFTSLARFLCIHLIYKIIDKLDWFRRFEVEKHLKNKLYKKGIIICENGFIEPPINAPENIMLYGYFQSEKYFKNYKEVVLRNLSLDSEIEKISSDYINKIKNRNSVCISIKVEHNVGNSLYDVCGKDYYEKAIAYINDHVDNPLYFICSDNVDYVLKHFIDPNKYDCVCQDKSLPVHISLAIMGLCNHFIISNTSFGWWAQYFSNYPQKTVIAPSPWMRVKMPIDIYQSNWKFIEVSDYINNGN